MLADSATQANLATLRERGVTVIEPDEGALASRGEAGRRFFNRRSYTTPASLAGVPALSLPCGFTAGGLPIGLQLIGRRFDEATLLRAGRAYERAAGWAGRRPPLPD